MRLVWIGIQLIATKYFRKRATYQKALLQTAVVRYVLTKGQFPIHLQEINVPIAKPHAHYNQVSHE